MKRTRYLQTGGRPSPFGERQTPYNPLTFNPFNPRPTLNPPWYDETSGRQLIPQGFWQNLSEARERAGHITDPGTGGIARESTANPINALTTSPTQPSGATVSYTHLTLPTIYSV